MASSEKVSAGGGHGGEGWPLRAAAAAVPIATAIEPEGQVRACALVLEAGIRLCLVTVDALTIPPRVLDEATAAIVAATGLQREHILLCATHSHHLPCTIDFLGCQPDQAWCEALREALTAAAIQACRVLDDPARWEATRAELCFAESQEATVGRNSRILLKDGMVGWYGYHRDDMLRPTGPYDPDIPVFAVRRPGGEMVSEVFAVSVHNIGSLRPGARSPGFLGLAAQEIERRHGGVGIFVPGAFGSSHNRTHESSGVPGPESVYRVVTAVEEGLAALRVLAVPAIRSLRRTFSYQIRPIDEAKEDAAVRAYGERYLGNQAAANREVFRQMRAEMVLRQGESRACDLQVIRVGDVALVAVPGELFARLGLALRRRSPFRHTYVLGLANGEIGYIPDRAAYDLGGYQLWAGWHSHLAPGSGEALVDQAVAMLHELR
jgi:hypothetical protein